MINFGDTGLIVQYIQIFLKENHDKTMQLSDIYDKQTHKALIEYLRLPEIISAHDMKNLLIKKFTLREKQPPNELIDGGGLWNFNYELTPDRLVFTNRDINTCFNGALKFIIDYKEKINEYCNQFGWNLTYCSKPNYIDASSKITFIIEQDSRKQLLPNKDIINMINFSTNDYLLNKCFVDENNAYHGFIQDSEYFKIAYIPIKAGDTFTISHGYKYSCEMAIGYTDNSLEELKSNSEICDVKNITSRLSKSKLGEINPGTYEVYNIPEDESCTYLLIQMPFKNNLMTPHSQKITIKLGDINQDGKITFDENDENSDYSLLKKYVMAIENNEPLPFKLSDKQKIAANLNKDIDINGNPVINKTDLLIFESKIKQFLNNGIPIDFGEIKYEPKINLSESDSDKLLVMFGDITKGNYNNELNIPITEFQDNPWIVHDEFLSYIMDSNIHKYSNISDITWLQNIIETLESKYHVKHYGLYDDANDYITNDKLIWNESKLLYEYYKNGLYTGIVMNNTGDIQNGYLRYENNMEKTEVTILNGKWLDNGVWNGMIVLSDGTISNNSSGNSLKEIVKQIQIQINKIYKNNASEQIKFINGYVNPLTEKYLNTLINN